LQTPERLKFKIFITLFLAVFATATGAGIVTPLLPVYAHELGAGAFQIGLIFGAFSLARSIFVPYFGKLSDRRGKKPLIATGLFIYFFLSLLYTLSSSVEMIMILRLGQGFASAMILPVAQAYVGIITPARREGRIMGLFNISLFGGLSLGPLMGGFLKDWFSIQVSFLSMGALTLLGFLLCLVMLPGETALQRGQTPDSSRPVPYLEIVRNPVVFSLFMFRACFTTCVGIIWAFLPLIASERLGLSSSAIGILVTTNVLVSGLLQAPMGLLADRYSKRALVITGGIIGVLSILFIDAAGSFRELLIANGLLGLAGGISFPAVMALGVIQGRRTGAMGSLMGLLALGHSLGMLAGPLLAGLLIDLSSFDTIFMAGAVILAAGTWIFLRSR
jgi:MFS family permease